MGKGGAAEDSSPPPGPTMRPLTILRAPFMDLAADFAVATSLVIFAFLNFSRESRLSSVFLFGPSALFCGLAPSPRVWRIQRLAPASFLMAARTAHLT